MNINHSFQDVWEQQIKYNQKIQRTQYRTLSEWMMNYILGVHSETAELLETLRWKYHRPLNPHNMHSNVEDDLADITKYVLSMWILAGFTPQQMLNSIYEKGEILDQLYKQEHKTQSINKKIIMLDLDGVVANFRTGFLQWVSNTEWELEIEEEQIGLHLDLNNGWKYNEYEQAKLEFELSGGYKDLPPISHILKIVKEFQENNWSIVIYTARPYKSYKRIWKDTWSWLISNGLYPDELHFGYTERVLEACKLSERNRVIAFEDDPTLIHRYAASGVNVCVVSQPYNDHIDPSPKISRFIKKPEET